MSTIAQNRSFYATSDIGVFGRDIGVKYLLEPFLWLVKNFP